jgi:crossover junction endodeoxyribonuclease RusA
MSISRSIVLDVRGDPKAQPRPRAFAFKGHVRVYDAGTAEGWKSLIAEAWRKSAPAGLTLSGPVRVDAHFEFRRPKSHYRTGKHSAELRPDAPNWHTLKPDRDNLDKSLLDALTQCGALCDDAIVCHGEVSKVYGEHPGATITVTRLDTL